MTEQNIETLDYQAELASARYRACGPRRGRPSCAQEFPALPSMWCSGCLIAALLQRQAKQADPVPASAPKMTHLVTGEFYVHGGHVWQPQYRDKQHGNRWRMRLVPTNETKLFSDDEIQPPNFPLFTGDPKQCAASAVPHPEPEQAIIEDAVSHWFIQGGRAQFGDLDLPAQNADGLISAILHTVRRALCERLGVNLAELSDVLSCSAAPLLPQAWQPIETAPKDGTRILGIRAGGGGHEVLRWTDSVRGRAAWTDGEYTYSPTHWMPLPLPPAPPLDRKEPT